MAKKLRTTVASASSMHVSHAPFAVGGDGKPKVDLLLALPSHLLIHVFCFATGSHAYSYVPRSTKSVLVSLPQLVCVSRSWHRFMVDLESERKLSTHHLRLETHVQQDDLDRECEALAASGEKIRELKLSMRQGDRVGGLYMLREERDKLHVLDALEIDWSRIFASCRKLVRLDLSDVPLNSAHIFAILDAASTHCLDLQALLLPGSGMGVYDREVDPAPVMKKVYLALEKWYTHGSNRGLIQLTVPKRQNYTDTDFNLKQHANEYLTAVARFCPNIEYLDGWKTTYHDTDDLRCNEMWFCSLDVWKLWCTACVKLREFNWFVAPFDDDFLDVFAASEKSTLRKMTIVCGNDDYYSDALISGEYYRPGGFQFSIQSVSQTLMACPALEELHVLFSARLYRTMWLQDKINDDFFRCVAHYCPKLTKIVVDEMDTLRRGQVIHTVTDTGLLAISRLPWLQSIAMKQTGCSPKGILGLVLNNPHPKDKRRVVLKLGNVGIHPQTSFFDAILAFMALVAAEPAEAVRSYRFELELHVLHVLGNGEVTNQSSTRAALVSLKRKLETQHPNIAIYFCGKSKKIRKVPGNLNLVSSIIFASPANMALSQTSNSLTNWNE